MKKVFALLLTLLMILSLTACGSSASPSNKAKAAYDAAEEEYGYWDAGEASTTAAPSDSEAAAAVKTAKMIYTANIDMETLSFDDANSDLTALVEQMGGYFEQRSLNNYSSGYRHGSYTVRVPAQRFEEFCNQVGTLCHVTYSNSGAQNISEVYYDTESRLVTAQTKLARLQELLSQADSMEDIITIESAISDTEWTIESLSGTLRSYDALVDYSTVYLELNEVYKLSGTDEAPVSFGGRMGSAFVNGLRAAWNTLEDLAVWLAYNWLGLVIAAAVVVLIIRICRRKGKKISLRRKNKKTEDSTEAE